jgi:DUF971 family protein
MTAWPTELSYSRSRRALTIAFESGERFDLSAELLRVESPSAEVKGHGGQKQIVPGKAHVGLTRMEPVGNYAVRLIFDDGHDSGLYTWAYLHELGQNASAVFQTYLDALAARGLTRE